MRTIVSLGPLACLALFALPSLGDTGEAAVSTPPIVFHSLAGGHLGTMPGDKGRPAGIAAGSRADGIWAEVAPANTFAGSGTAVLVFGSREESSEAMARFGGRGRAHASLAADLPATVACISVEGRTDGDPGDPWLAGMSQQVVMLQPGMGSMQHRVQSAHVERLTTTADGRTALEWTDAWVDSVTAGAKMVAKGSVPLTRVAVGPSGLGVYAAKEDGWVHFVVRGASATGKGDSMELMQMQMMGREIEVRTPNDPRQGAASDCGFARQSLPAGKSAMAMAIFETMIVLPPVRPAPAQAVDSDSGGPMAMAAIRRVRPRPLIVNVSSSQSSSDAEPVLSVAFGWAGPEQRN